MGIEYILITIIPMQAMSPWMDHYIDSEINCVMVVFLYNFFE